MKKYSAPKLDVIIIDVEDNVNTGDNDISAVGGWIRGDGLAKLIDDELTIERGYNNEGFDR